MQANLGDFEATSNASGDNFRQVNLGYWDPATSVQLDDLSQYSIQQDLEKRLRHAIWNGDNVLFEGIPTTGKSTVASTIADAVAPQILYLTHRYEIREECAEKATEAGLTPHILAVFHRDCPTAAGKHGQDMQQNVLDMRDRRIPPGKIHELLDLPCQHNSECPYLSAWDVDTAEPDLLIGHPTHARIPYLTKGRAVIVDEDPGEAFEIQFPGQEVTDIVNPYLKYTNLIDATTKDELRSLNGSVGNSQALGTEDLQFAIDNPNGHVLAPLIVRTLVEGIPLGNGFERVETDDFVGLYDVKNETVTLRQPPDLSYTAAVVGLDGTPLPELWENRLGVELDHRRLLSDQERHDYINNYLGYDIIQTTENERPYSSGKYVHEGKDNALIRAIEDKHGCKPAVITTGKAEDQLLDSNGYIGMRLEDDDVEHYYNLKSLNRFRNRTLACILGSVHPGDREIQRLAALDGYCVTRQSTNPQDFGETGNPYLQYVREQHVVQAIFRFGREAQGATIYVNTSAIPEWLEPNQVDGVVRMRTETEQEILRCLYLLGSATRAEIEDELPDQIEVGSRTVRKHLNKLVDEGCVHKTGKGRGTEYHDDGIDETIWTARVDLTT